MSQAGTIAGQFAVFVKRGRDATHKSTKVLPHAPEYHPQEVFFFHFSKISLPDKLPKSKAFPFVWKFWAKIKSKQTPPKTIARANEIKHKQLKDVRQKGRVWRAGGVLNTSVFPPTCTHTHKYNLHAYVSQRRLGGGNAKGQRAAQCVSVTCP